MKIRRVAPKEALPRKGHFVFQSGHKTLLQLAIDEDDHDTTEYIETLLKVGHGGKDILASYYKQLYMDIKCIR